MSIVKLEENVAVIIFHDKSQKFINQNQHNAIFKAHSNPNVKTIEIDRSMYFIASMSKILTLEEYYIEYPDKKPERKFENQFTKYEGVEQMANSKNGLESLIRGLKKFIDESFVETPKAQEHLDRMIKKYERQYLEIKTN